MKGSNKMKNTVTINTIKHCVCDCIDAVCDGSNSIYLHFIVDKEGMVEFSNGSSIKVTPADNVIAVPQSWYLDADLSFIFSNDDHASNEFTIKKPTSTTGNMTISMVDNFVYQVKFKDSSSGSGGGSYELPIASADTLGGVMIGENVEIDETGKISVFKDGFGLTEITYAEYLANKEEYDASGKAYAIPDFPSVGARILVDNVTVSLNGNGDGNLGITESDRKIISIHLVDKFNDISLVKMTSDDYWRVHSSDLKSTTVTIRYYYIA